MADEFTKAALYWIKTFNKKVKEKIWMEKLIELLNKHRRETVKKQSWITEWRYNAFTFSLDNISWQQAELLIISKQYWFIKRLVENDKIDIKKLIVKGEMRSGWDFENKKWDEEEGEEIWNKYFSELCLMILAIQDEPIDFLISILK